MSDISSMIISFGSSIPYIEKLITGAGYVFGLAFIFSGIVTLLDLSSKQKKSEVKGGWGYPATYFLAGAALLWLPTTVDSLNLTFFGSDSVLSYSTSATAEELKQDVIYVVTQIIEMVGVFWIVHGFTLFAYSPKADPNDQKHSNKHAWVFVFGGLLAVNNEFTLELIKNSMQSLVTGKYSFYPLQQTVESLM